MAREGLFEDLPEQRAPAAPAGRPRLREPARNQPEWRMVDLDSLVAEDHPARLIWAYVERLDLSDLEARIKAREGRPGQPPPTPRLLVALWLYATSDGIGSARELARLCQSHDAYRWLCGGVSMNYHTLSDFRVDHPELLERLLIENVAALAQAGVIDLDTLAQDGVRVRAAAGAASFRRRKTLEEPRAAAVAVVARLKRELDEDPAASSRRQQAARERAAREREARVEAALAALAEAEHLRVRREKKDKRKTERQKEPRASTTDPEARVIKMADGGFRPAYNLQVTSAPEQQIVVAVDAVATGSDRGLLRAMLAPVVARLGFPQRLLVDGGFTKNEDIEWAHAQGTAVFCPPINNKHRTDPFAPRHDDGPGLQAWRERMKGNAGKATYKRRAIAECIHARWRGWDLIQLTVRGLAKVKTVLGWFALANNVLQGHRLLAAAAA